MDSQVELVRRFSKLRDYYMERRYKYDDVPESFTHRDWEIYCEGIALGYHLANLTITRDVDRESEPYRSYLQRRESWSE